ncbi:helix-turn-helix resolvase-like protein [Paraburkholderia sp. BL23I1N1]|nr:helix-turn-helix resolvase-like protein [Paraburkholderia sp. BL23I1N1]
MGRKSALTPEQWAEVERRLIAGEARRALAREFGISEAAIRQKLSSRVDSIKTVANQLATANTALQRLPIASQITAQNLAARLMSVSEHLLAAADYGAATARRLAGIAHTKSAEIDDANPLTPEGVEALKGISALTRMANDASEIGVNLLRANKEAVEDINKRNAEGSRVENYTDEQLDQLIAQHSAALGIDPARQG